MAARRHRSVPAASFCAARMDGEAVPGVERILRGARGAFAGGDGHVERLQAIADVGRLLRGGEQGARIPEIAGLAGRLVMRGGRREIAGREIALRQRERVIGEGDARGEVEQRQGEREARGPVAASAVRQARGQRDGGEEDHRRGNGEHGELLADDSGGERGSQAGGQFGMLAADLPRGGEPERAPRDQQQQSGDALRHQRVEEDVVRRFVGEIRIRARQCGGLVMREGGA